MQFLQLALSIFNIKKIFIARIRSSQRVVKHKDVDFIFSTPNWLCEYRAKSFSEKEPETLAWIDTFSEGKIFWDIGANVGLYSIYAAKTRKCSVFSFEPSVFNLEFLARNIFLNDLSEKVCIVPLAIGDSVGVGTLNMSSTEWGGALSTFGKDYGYDGKTLNKKFLYSTLSITLDDVVSKFNIPMPSYIKIDVDGIEHLILSGGQSVLKNATSILVEIYPSFIEQSELSKKFLEDAGLILKETVIDASFRSGDDISIATYNQIWIRDCS